MGHAQSLFHTINYGIVLKCQFVKASWMKKYVNSIKFLIWFFTWWLLLLDDCLTSQHLHLSQYINFVAVIIFTISSWLISVCTLDHKRSLYFLVPHQISELSFCYLIDRAGVCDPRMATGNVWWFTVFLYFYRLQTGRRRDKKVAAVRRRTPKQRTIRYVGVVRVDLETVTCQPNSSPQWKSTRR